MPPAVPVSLKLVVIVNYYDTAIAAIIDRSNAIAEDVALRRSGPINGNAALSALRTNRPVFGGSPGENSRMHCSSALGCRSLLAEPWPDGLKPGNKCGDRRTRLPGRRDDEISSRVSD